MAIKLPPETPVATYAVSMEDLAAIQPPELHVTLSAEPEFPADLGRLVGPLAAVIDLERKGPHLLVHARIKGELELVCHRCLSDYRQAVDLDVDEHMVVQKEEPEEEIEWELATVAESISPEGALDLVDFVRQHVILDLPAKQLCQAACALPAAAMVTTEGDPRWSGLAALRQLEQGDDRATT